MQQMPAKEESNINSERLSAHSVIQFGKKRDSGCEERKRGGGLRLRNVQGQRKPFAGAQGAHFSY